PDPGGEEVHGRATGDGTGADIGKDDAAYGLAGLQRDAEEEDVDRVGLLFVAGAVAVRHGDGRVATGRWVAVPVGDIEGELLAGAVGLDDGAGAAHGPVRAGGEES